MSQEKRPPAVIVQRYDPRQSPAAEPKAGVSPVAAEPAQAETPPGGTALATSKPVAAQPPAAQSTGPATGPVEIGGPSGPEPTRYGDWERNGRVSDF
jgi:homeobox protein ESX1